MDILRKELDDIYKSQNLDEQVLDTKWVEKARQQAETFAGIAHGCAVVTDASSDRCYIYSRNFGKVMGYTQSDSSYIYVDSSDEDLIYSRIHPEDLVDKRLLEFEFFKLVRDKSPDDKKNFIAKCRLRMKDCNGDFRYVDNTTQLLFLSPNDNIWLILCTYNFSVEKNNENRISPVILDTSTGDYISLALGEKRKSILSEREKEILILIKDGKSSKMIADTLNISVHTVNRHRQNIIEKLSVGNSIETVTAATVMNLL